RSGSWKRRNREDQILLRQQRQSLNIPGQVVHRTGGGQHGGFPRGEGEAHQIESGDFDAGFSVGRDAYDAAFCILRSGDVKIAIEVESQSLWASEAAEEVADGTVAVDPVDAVET